MRVTFKGTMSHYSSVCLLENDSETSFYNFHLNMSFATIQLNLTLRTSKPFLWFFHHILDLNYGSTNIAFWTLITIITKETNNCWKQDKIGLLKFRETQTPMQNFVGINLFIYVYIYFSFSVILTAVTGDTTGHQSDYRYRQYLYINIFMGNRLKQTKKN